MVLYKIFKKINVLYEKYSVRCQNEILKKSIQNLNGKLGEDIVFGNNVSIGSNAFIRAEGGLSIGNNVVISRNLVLYTNSHNYKKDLLPFDNTYLNNSVIIEDNIWIGMNVTISPGTIIREGAIIGLGSRIFGEIPPLAIVGSSDINIIGYRDEKHYKDLKNFKEFCKENGEEYYGV